MNLHSDTHLYSAINVCTVAHGTKQTQCCVSVVCDEEGKDEALFQLKAVFQFINRSGFVNAQEMI